MSPKYLAILIGSFLLVNYCYSAPAASAEDSDESLEDILKHVEAGFTLIETVVDEINALDKLVATDGKAILDKVLADPKVIEKKTPEIEKDLSEIRIYSEKLGKSLEEGGPDASDKIVEYETFENLVDKYNKDEHEDLSDDEEIIGKSLEENGIQKFEETVAEHLTKFFQKLIAQVGDYIENTLSEKDKEGDAKSLVVWYEKLKAEEDLEKRIDIISEFFGKDDSSEEKKD